MLSGLKPGDEVVTGPYNSVRGDDGRATWSRSHNARSSARVNKFLDSAGIAISAIWAAKLRSLMTVLGNIVAVTSIIAVVSLIQGLNASVKQAILNQAGADSFNIQQFPSRAATTSSSGAEQPAHDPAGRPARARPVAAR